MEFSEPPGRPCTTVSGSAQSYLFVPATRPDRVAKAAGLDVDVVIVDLEDAVSESDKDSGRVSLAALGFTRRVHVRINSLATPHWQADAELCSSLDFVDALVVSMVTSPAEFDRVRAALVRPLPLLALVETPRGIQAVDEIADAGFERLLFGGADYCAALGAAPSAELYAYPRSRLVVASAAAGLHAPVDGPTTAFNDLTQLREDLKAARGLGMGGKLCIHPSQLPIVRQVFALSEADRSWAIEVVTAAELHGGSVFSMDGQMIDEPIVERARRILRR